MRFVRTLSDLPFGGKKVSRQERLQTGVHKAGSGTLGGFLCWLGTLFLIMWRECLQRIVSMWHVLLRFASLPSGYRGAARDAR